MSITDRPFIGDTIHTCEVIIPIWQKWHSKTNTSVSSATIMADCGLTAASWCRIMVSASSWVFSRSLLCIVRPLYSSTGTEQLLLMTMQCCWKSSSCLIRSSQIRSIKADFFRDTVKTIFWGGILVVELRRYILLALGPYSFEDTPSCWQLCTWNDSIIRQGTRQAKTLCHTKKKCIDLYKQCNYW